MTEEQEEEVLSEIGITWQSVHGNAIKGMLENYMKGLMDRKTFITAVFTNLVRSYYAITEKVAEQRSNLTDCIVIIQQTVLALGYTLEDPHPAQPTGILWGALTDMLRDLNVDPKGFLLKMFDGK